jgi:hypothetical protein
VSDCPECPHFTRLQQLERLTATLMLREDQLRKDMRRVLNKHEGAGLKLGAEWHELRQLVG